MTAEEVLQRLVEINEGANLDSLPEVQAMRGIIESKSGRGQSLNSE